MIIEKIVGNLKTMQPQSKHMEKVYLRSDDLVKRIQRVTTDHGNELGIRLKEQQDLRDGDVLYMDEKNAIVVSVLAEELLIIRPNSLQQMGEIAHQLGNRHLPAQFRHDEMIIQYDYLIEDLLKQLGISYSREMGQVEQAFRHVGHSHG